VKKAIVFPAKYVQGEGVLADIGDIIQSFGLGKPMLIWGNHARAVTNEIVLSALDTRSLDHSEWVFVGECTENESRNIEDSVIENRCDIIIGLGGGKCLDISKAVAAHLGLRIVVCPTICASDAPTSACTVWYDENGACTGFDLWPSNPDVILVDTGITIHSPKRMLMAGIGDAMATYFEAEASNRSHAITCSGGAPTMSVMALAELCYKTLIKDTDAALSAVEAGVVTPAYERLIEACILLSGIGWESGGLATAHTLGNNLSTFSETHSAMHGEKVTFGLVTQLMLDQDMPMDEVNQVMDFMVEHRLPVTLEALKMGDVTDERLMDFCEANTQPGSFTNNHSFPVGAKDLFNAMKAADVYGKKRIAAHKKVS